jgi:hypothetical protein
MDRRLPLFKNHQTSDYLSMRALCMCVGGSGDPVESDQSPRPRVPSAIAWQSRIFGKFLRLGSTVEQVTENPVFQAYPGAAMLKL